MCISDLKHRTDRKWAYKGDAVAEGKKKALYAARNRLKGV